MINRAYYADAIEDFLKRSSDEILGVLSRRSAFAIESTQRDAWISQTEILQKALSSYRARGKVYFEYPVPRLGKRIDAVVLIDQVIFIIKFKVGEKKFTPSARDHLWDYALDLKNFHETTHNKPVAPVLVVTGAETVVATIATTQQDDGVLLPIYSSSDQLATIFERVLLFCDGPPIDPGLWDLGRYHPTPTSVEAAIAFYSGHNVAEISRSDAGAVNLSQTSEAVAKIIQSSRELSRKSIYFVPGFRVRVKHWWVST